MRKPRELTALIKNTRRARVRDSSNIATMKPPPDENRDDHEPEKPGQSDVVAWVLAAIIILFLVGFVFQR